MTVVLSVTSGCLRVWMRSRLLAAVAVLSVAAVFVASIRGRVGWRPECRGVRVGRPRPAVQSGPQSLGRPVALLFPKRAVHAEGVRQSRLRFSRDPRMRRWAAKRDAGRSRHSANGRRDGRHVTRQHRRQVSAASGHRGESAAAAGGAVPAARPQPVVAELPGGFALVWLTGGRAHRRRLRGARLRAHPALRAEPLHAVLTHADRQQPVHVALPRERRDAREPLSNQLRRECHGLLRAKLVSLFVRTCSRDLGEDWASFQFASYYFYLFIILFLRISSWNIYKSKRHWVMTCHNIL